MHGQTMKAQNANQRSFSIRKEEGWSPLLCYSLVAAVVGFLRRDRVRRRFLGAAVELAVSSEATTAV